MRKYLLLSSLSLLAACDKAPLAQPEAVRPVKTMQVGMLASQTALSLPGEVRARHETPLAFRVGGKVSACKVDLGDTVRRGQLLARLEPADLQLAARGSAAGEAQARSALTLAEADLARYRTLHDKGFVSAATIDQKQAAADAARAVLDAMQSAHAEQSRKVGYTDLLADSDGIVTARDCSTGQVVSAGQPVLRLAQGRELEIAVDVPEDMLARIRSAAGFTLSLNAVPGKNYAGKLRELAAAADPATRTFAARIAVSAADAGMHIGMSATLGVPASGELTLQLPLGAVVSRDHDPGVWVVDANAIVHRTAVRLGAIEGNSVRVTGGLGNGDTVVIAGANLLRDGEKVKSIQ